MNVLFCRRWLLTLLMSVTGAGISASNPHPDIEANPMPISCRMSVSHSVVDYGMMSRWQLQNIGNGSVSPGTRSLTMSVFCPYSQTMYLQVHSKNSDGGLRYGEHGIIRIRLLDALL